MDEVEKVTKDTIKDGGVLALLYFDIHAKTKEDVQALGAGFVNQIIQQQGVVYALGEIDEPVGGQAGKNWSSNVQIKVLVKDFRTLGHICLSHSPFTVEILRPDEIKLQLSDAHELLGMMAATTADYKKYIVTKIAKPEELAQIHADLKARAEMGKKILERKNEESEKKDDMEKSSVVKESR